MREYHTPKAMKRLGDLFEKYRSTLRAPQASVEKECIDVISEVTGFTLQATQVVYTVSTRTLSLQVPSIIKTELRFHQTVILQQLQARLGENNCPKHLR